MKINGSYRFEVGDFECVSITDGSLNYRPESFFSNVAIEKVKSVLREHNLPADSVTTPYTYLYVNTGEERVLVDMGAGNMAPSTGNMLQNMKAAGIEPLDIDTVVITHAHPDHVGGTLDDSGKPVYANARYFIFRREWDFWFSEGAGDQAPQRHVDIARQNLEPLRDRIQLLDEETEILPGIGVIKAPGHTPGHIVVSITSGDAQLLYISDTVLYPLHLEYPGWVPVYDILPEEAEESKHKIFDRAAADQVLVLGMHFPPFPSLGHVVKKDVGWEWQPSKG